MDSEPSTVRLCFFGLCKGGRSFKTKGVDVERDLPFISGLAVWPLFYDFCTKALLLLFVPLAGRLLASYLFLSLFLIHLGTEGKGFPDFRFMDMSIQILI